MATITQAGSPPESTSRSEPSSTFFSYPDTLTPLPKVLKTGLYAPGTLGVVSAACTIGMLMFIIYRFLTWRAHYRTFVGYNQYVVLIVNLLVADLFQGVSFMFSFHWIYHDGIFAPTKTCFTQGFMLNTGDLASGCFVLGVALHTFYGAVKGKHVKHSTFTILVISAWVFAILFSSFGPIRYGHTYYVRAGAWCWASPKYEKARLAFHYVWIFIVQFGTIVIYTLIFLHLKNTLTTILPASQSTTHAKVDRAAKLMLLFPASYLILTLPLSIGRMWSMAHNGKGLPYHYLLLSGSLIGSSGIVDCLLYTMTRRSLVKSSMHSTKKDNSSTGGSYDLSRLNGITQTRTVTVTGDRLSIISDDATLGANSARIITDSPQKTYTINDGRSHSPTGSADRMVGVDPRKPEHKVQISTYGIEDFESGGGSIHSNHERSNSPVNVMKELARMAKLQGDRN